MDAGRTSRVKDRFILTYPMPVESGPNNTAKYRIVTALMKIAAENDNKTGIFWLWGSWMRCNTRRGRAISIPSEMMSCVIATKLGMLYS